MLFSSNSLPPEKKIAFNRVVVAVCRDVKNEVFFSTLKSLSAPFNCAHLRCSS
jgi:hypothetical protein